MPGAGRPAGALPEPAGYVPAATETLMRQEQPQWGGGPLGAPQHPAHRHTSPGLPATPTPPASPTILAPVPLDKLSVSGTLDADPTPDLQAFGRLGPEPRAPHWPPALPGTQAPVPNLTEMLHTSRKTLPSVAGKLLHSPQNLSFHTLPDAHQPCLSLGREGSLSSSGPHWAGCPQLDTGPVPTGPWGPGKQCEARGPGCHGEP